MPRTTAEIIADLAAKTSDSPTLRHMDTMRLYKAIQRLPMNEIALLVEEMSHGHYAVVPSSPPHTWNPVKRRGYSILIGEAKQTIIAPPDHPPDG